MDSLKENIDAKAVFRKPSNDAANRKYRHRSPVSCSSSSDGSPKCERGSSPIPSQDDHRRKDDGRDLERDSDRSRHGRSGDSSKYSDRQYYRSSHNYHRLDEYSRHEKHVDDEGRDSLRLSSRSGRDFKGRTHSDRARRDSEHGRSRDHLRDAEKYSPDKYEGSGHGSRDKERETSSVECQMFKDKDAPSYRAGSGRRRSNSEYVKSGERDKHRGDRDGRDEKRDYRRSIGDYKGDVSPTYEESRGHRNDSNSRRESSGHRLKEASRGDPKELDGNKYNNEEKKIYDDRETNRHKERYSREHGEQLQGKTLLTSKDQESPAKKLKLFSSDGVTNRGKDVSKFTSAPSESQSSTSKLGQEFVGKVGLEQADVKDTDIDAAKLAAMKAAELVNRNLIGTGYMSAEQKKKLLWGNKKSTTSEESTCRWDTAMFGDRERQEKFNKLMSLRLPWYLWPIVGCEGRYKSGAKGQRPRWQWHPPSREAEGTPGGFREAVYRRTPSKGWPYCRTRSLRTFLPDFCTCRTAFTHIIIVLLFKNNVCCGLSVSWLFRGNLDKLLEFCDGHCLVYMHSDLMGCRCGVVLCMLELDISFWSVPCLFCESSVSIKI